jgi:hypothetical protein
MCLVFFLWVHEMFIVYTDAPLFSRCIVVNNLWFSMLSIKVSATMPVQGSRWMCQCNANWVGRRTAACCLLAGIHCPVSWVVRVREANCLVGLLSSHVEVCVCLTKLRVVLKLMKFRCFHLGLSTIRCMTIPFDVLNSFILSFPESTASIIKNSQSCSMK